MGLLLSHRSVLTASGWVQSYHSIGLAYSPGRKLCAQQTKTVHKMLQFNMLSHISVLHNLCNSRVLVVVLHFKIFSYTHCRPVTDP